MSKNIYLLNADLGEGSHHDALIMPHLCYCNIACGGHTGDAQSMTNAILLAQKYEVKIGAHPSYPDPENFGRAAMDIPYGDLSDSLIKQLRKFKEVADTMNAEVHHVKAHGALYHKIVEDAGIRKIYFQVVNHVFQNVKIMVPSHTDPQTFDVPSTHLMLEAFADRQYDKNLKLLSRDKPGAIIYKPEDIASQIHKLHHNGKVLDNTGAWIDIRFDTICIHGDHAGIDTYFPQVINLLEAHNLVQ